MIRKCERKKMRGMRKILSKCAVVLLTVTMVVAMGIPAFAEEESSESNENKGTLTINHTVDGKEIDLYQIFSATVSNEENTKKVTYKLNTDYESFFQGKIEGASQKTGEDLSEEAYQYVLKNGKDNASLAKELLAYTDEKKIEASRSPLSEKDATKVTFLLYGYYLVVPEGATDDSETMEGASVTSPAMLVSVTGDDATINMKSNYPTIDKEILPVEGSTEEEKAEDAEIGDSIRYELKSKVPDMTGYSSYIFRFVDTLSEGLEYKEIKSVTVGNTTLTPTEDESGENTYRYTYEENSDETHTLTIDLNDFFQSFQNHVGEEIRVVYTAVLDEKAEAGLHGNKNSAEVHYSNKPGTTEVGKSTPSEAEVYDFNFKIFKQNEEKKPLAGAQFALYESKKENGKNVIDEKNQISFVKEETKDGSNIYRKALTGETGGAIIESNADGYAEVRGLKHGTYFLREIEAPKGYNKLVGDIKVDISSHYNTEENGDLSSFDVEYLYGEDDKTVNVKDADKIVEIPVVNKTGAELPATGSVGAWIFTSTGILLLGMLAVNDVKKKKMKRE